MTQISRFWYGIETGDAGTYDDDQFAKVMETLTYNQKQANSLAIGGVDGTASSGSYPLKVYENSPTAMNVKVDKGAYWFLGRLYLSDAIETITIDSNSSGNPRIDSVILECDYVEQTIRLGIMKGTSASSPVAPTLTQTIGTLYQYKLADIAVANGATTIVNANITNTGATTTYGGNVNSFASALWVSQTNTNVTLSQNTNDISLGWSVTFTPSGNKVAMFLQFASVYSYVSGVSTYHQAGYKVNSGSIVYIDQDTGTTEGGFQNDGGSLLIVPNITVTAGQSNTITFYAKTGNTPYATTYFWHGRVMVMEQAN